MTVLVENILVLFLVAAAAVYTIVRLRRVGAGQSKCVCGSEVCAPATGPCDGGVEGAAATSDSSPEQVSPSCNQGCRGCGKS
jgi:hypothetical protein